jgi:hypothetical protein
MFPIDKADFPCLMSAAYWQSPGWGCRVRHLFLLLDGLVLSEPSSPWMFFGRPNHSTRARLSSSPRHTREPHVSRRQRSVAFHEACPRGLRILTRASWVPRPHHQRGVYRLKTVGYEREIYPGRTIRQSFRLKIYRSEWVRLTKAKTG